LKIANVVENHCVFFAASSQRKDSFNEIILKSHVFGKTIEIKPLIKLQRVQILKELFLTNRFTKNSKTQLNFEDIAGKMDGYSVSDILNFFEMLVKEKKIKCFDQGANLEIDSTDFDQTLLKFKPFQISHSKLQECLVEWSNIGGLEEAKRILLETLQWPTLYPQIFSCSPLRLRSGILLYGYPG
jgi:peroxin-1